MILILSSSGDSSSDFVIEWLKYYNHPYFRLNSQYFIEKNIEFNLNDGTLFLNREKIDIKSINCIWYRKFGFFKYSTFYKFASQVMDNDSLMQIQKEYYSLLNAFLSLLKDKFWLVNPYNAQINKLDVLRRAQKCGLNIPKTYVLNNTEDMQKLTCINNYISKSIADSFFLKEKKGYYSMYTKDIDKKIINKLPKYIFPSLMQGKIKKDYEIRVFYLDGKMYSMAIFSQNDKQTSVDFRNYNQEKPNRYIPYLLPKSLEYKINKLMINLGLNSGSLDLIKSEDGIYYFLEVNPSGQFGMVSLPCNYDLHKLVAKYLIKKDKKTKKTCV